MPRISSLNLGLPASDHARLASRFRTVEAFLLHKGAAPVDVPAEVLTKLLSYVELNEVPRVRSGLELHAELQHSARLLPTGCSSLNDLLRGGYREGHLTELWGPPASGKTQLCMQAAAATAARGECCTYLDTTASCSVSRLAVMCRQPEDSAANAAGAA